MIYFIALDGRSWELITLEKSLLIEDKDKPLNHMFSVDPDSNPFIEKREDGIYYYKGRSLDET